MNYVSIDRLWEKMGVEDREKALLALPDIKGLLCYAFPYLADEEEGNISLYARGKDYHKVVGEMLEAECDKLRISYPQNTFLPYVDVSPFPEAYAAAMSGLGKLGKNGLLITEKYGSFVFIGVIATNLEVRGKATVENCIGCDACIKSCPNGAISEKGVDKNRCLSEITQKKGELTEDEKALMRKHNTAWGCDICQLVCPMNKGVAKTHIPQFETDLICTLTSSDLQDSNKQLQKKYSDRAFIWRGAAVLKRNTEILENK